MSQTVAPAAGDLVANKQLAIAFLEQAFANHVEQAMALLADDATWWVIGTPGRLKVSGTKTRAQIERLLQIMVRLAPAGLQMKVKGITAEGTRVALEIEGEGDFANGRHYHNLYHFLIEVRDGRVLRVREYMDTLHVADTLAD